MNAPEANNSSCAVIGVDYDDGRPQSYRGVRLAICPDPLKAWSQGAWNQAVKVSLFFTRDPTADYAATRKAASKLSLRYIANSSTVDDFVADGGNLCVSASPTD
jgi:hypothetical protein